ncbi:TRAP transporter large permease subunit [Histidinibacterium aquaticum]|uniref:TRAP transporter large permease subunit n=2 Tax=Histidinibacterium aquaticum TaxID=2613962 RepID=A0A5J5GL73_9RHOB|nr:TRAP transporter large permease subunit [Histidinibacterium aquaticum]
MVLVCTDVVSRAFANSPIAGVAEVVSFSVPATVFLALPYCIRTGRFLRADFLLQRLEPRSPRGGALLNLVFNAVGVVVFAKITQTVWPRLLDQIEEAEFFGAIGAFTAPVWPFTTGILVGAVLAALQFALMTLQEARDFRSALATDRDGSTVFALVVVFLVVCGAGLVYLVTGDLSRVDVGIFSIIGMLALVLSGMHLASALIVLSFLGIWMIRGTAAVAEGSLAIATTGSINSYAFAVIPLFVLMGLFIEVADVGRDAFSVLARLLRRIRGGLGIATVFANGIFAAITGSTIASATVFTRVAAPPMISNGYTSRFAVGVVAGSSVLGMLIPPSILLLIFGLIAEVSIGALFTAAILPGLLLASAFALLVLGLSWFAPDFVGNSMPVEDMESVTLGEVARRLLPIVLLVALVLGGIYGGFFTPTESGAVGAAGAFIIALVRRSLSLQRLRTILLETAEISGSILFLVVAANLYSRMLTLSAIPQSITDWVIAAELGMMAFLLLYLVIVVLLGMILDSVSIMLVLLPLMLPIVQSLGGDLVWFGIVTVVAVEIGLLTPPFGLAVYVVKGTLPPGTATLGDIFKGAAPFVLTMLAVVLILMAFPAISLALL